MFSNLRNIFGLLVGAAMGAIIFFVSIFFSQHKISFSEDRFEAVDEMRAVTEVMERVRHEFVDSVADDVLIAGAIRGMLSELDKHSHYLTAEEYAEIQRNSAGSYTGVGLNVSLEGGQVTVVAPLEGTPAQRAGILPLDVVISVDDMAVDGEDLAETVKRFRGVPGTAVTVDVRREGETETLHFSLTRANIQATTVYSEYLGNGYGYIKLTGFSDSTASELGRAADHLIQRSKPSLLGVVLDLRDNVGGVLGAAVKVADAFLDEGLIVRGNGRMRSGRFEEFATRGDILGGAELIVLVNGGSASASEIVAGALKDHKRAHLIGERTYGKGSVQTVMPLTNGRAIKITTSRYFTPSGNIINGTGIEPDILVFAGPVRARYSENSNFDLVHDDNQLQEALRTIGFNSLGTE